MCQTDKSSPYFDDCPICQYVKQQESKNRPLMMDELKQSFEKARNTNKGYTKIEE